MPPKLSPAVLEYGPSSLYSRARLTSHSSTDDMDYPINKTNINPNHSRTKSYTGDSGTNKHGSSVFEVPVDNKKRRLFDDKVRSANFARQAQDYELAVQLYTEALELDPFNYMLYGNRSQAHVERGCYEEALKDAKTAKQLNEEWPKVRRGSMRSGLK